MKISSKLARILAEQERPPEETKEPPPWLRKKPVRGEDNNYVAQEQRRMGEEGGDRIPPLCYDPKEQLEDDLKD